MPDQTPVTIQDQVDPLKALWNRMGQVRSSQLLVSPEEAKAAASAGSEDALKQLWDSFPAEPSDGGDDGRATPEQVAAAREHFTGSGPISNTAAAFFAGLQSGGPGRLVAKAVGKFSPSVAADVEQAPNYVPQTFVERVAHGAGSLFSDAPIMAATGGAAGAVLKGSKATPIVQRLVHSAAVGGAIPVGRQAAAAAMGERTQSAGDLAADVIKSAAAMTPAGALAPSVSTAGKLLADPLKQSFALALGSEMVNAKGGNVDMDRVWESTAENLPTFLGLAGVGVAHEKLAQRAAAAAGPVVGPQNKIQPATADIPTENGTAPAPAPAPSEPTGEVHPAVAALRNAAAGIETAAQQIEKSLAEKSGAEVTGEDQQPTPPAAAPAETPAAMSADSAGQSAPEPRPAPVASAPAIPAEEVGTSHPLPGTERHSATVETKAGEIAYDPEKISEGDVLSAVENGRLPDLYDTGDAMPAAESRGAVAAKIQHLGEQSRAMNERNQVATHTEVDEQGNPRVVVDSSETKATAAPEEPTSDVPATKPVVETPKEKATRLAASADAAGRDAESSGSANDHAIASKIYQQAFDAEYEAANSKAGRKAALKTFLPKIEFHQQEADRIQKELRAETNAQRRAERQMESEFEDERARQLLHDDRPEDALDIARRLTRGGRKFKTPTEWGKEGSIYQRKAFAKRQEEAANALDGLPDWARKMFSTKGETHLEDGARALDSTRGRGAGAGERGDLADLKTGPNEFLAAFRKAVLDRESAFQRWKSDRNDPYAGMPPQWAAEARRLDAEDAARLTNKAEGERLPAGETDVPTRSDKAQLIEGSPRAQRAGVPPDTGLHSEPGQGVRRLGGEARAEAGAAADGRRQVEAARPPTKKPVVEMTAAEMRAELTAAGKDASTLDKAGMIRAVRSLRKSSGLHADEIRAEVDAAMPKVSGRVEVRETPEEFPDNVKAEGKKQGGLDGVRAAYDPATGKLWLAARNIARAVERGGVGATGSARHELLHAWLNETPEGRDLKNNLERQAWQTMTMADQKYIGRRYNLRELGKAGAGEEWLAKLAEDVKDTAMGGRLRQAWLKVTAEVRQMLRDKLGLRIAFTENDVRQMLRKAEAHVVGETAGAKGRGSVRLASDDQKPVDRDEERDRIGAQHETDRQLEQGKTGAGASPGPNDRLASDAEAFVRGEIQTVGGERENPATRTESERQAGRLVEWAKSKNAFIPDAHFEGLKKFPEVTAEHDVFDRPSDGRVVKRTFPGTFGTSEGEPGTGATTPEYYLKRIQEMNREFGTDVRMEGVWMGDTAKTGWRGHGKEPSIVTSQSFIDAKDVEHPNPTEEEVAAYMRSHGFEPWGTARHGWIRSDGMVVMDAHPKNFINSPTGIVPIDLVIKKGGQPKFARDPETDGEQIPRRYQVSQPGMGAERDVLDTDTGDTISSHKNPKEAAAEADRLNREWWQGVQEKHEGSTASGTQTKLPLETEHGRALQHASDGFLKDVRAVRDIFAPQAGSPEALKTADLIRSIRGAHETDINRADRALTSERRYFDRFPVSKGWKYEDGKPLPPNYQFMVDYENGAVTDPRLKPFAKTMRQITDGLYDLVQQVKPDVRMGYIEHYLPHLWENEKQAAEFNRTYFQQAKLEGSKGFTRERFLRYFSEGLKSGLRPASDNPVELMMANIRQVHKFAAAHQIVAELQKMGIPKYVNEASRNPYGYSSVDDPVFMKFGLPYVTVQGEPGEGQHYGKGQRTMPAKVVLGHWSFPDSVAQVLNNYLSPSLQTSPIYRSARGLSNLLNQSQLGLSAFHVGFTSLEANVSRVALGLMQASRGEFGGALKSLATSPTAFITNPMHGWKLREELRKPGSQGPEYAALARAMEAAGGKAEPDEMWKSEITRNMLRAWREGTASGKVRAIMRAPFAAFEPIQRMIFEQLVPLQKLGEFSDLARLEMDRLGDNYTPEQYRRAMSRAWDSVDNRMGMMVYDNTFQKRWVKELMQISFRAYGWQLGKYREMGGAAVDLAKAAADVKAGKVPEMTPRMAYAIALPMTVGTLGAVMTYMATGKSPEDWRDYFFPRTGENNPDGSPARVNLPSYLKDIVAFGRHPTEAITRGLNPGIAFLTGLNRNQDYFGTQIVNPDDPMTAKLMSLAGYTGKQFLPFTLTSMAKMAENGTPMYKRVGAFFGLVPTGHGIVATPAEELSIELMKESRPGKARSAADTARSKLVADLANAYRSQDPVAVQKSVEAVKRGEVDVEQAKRAFRMSQMTPLQYRVSGLGIEDGMRVWTAADQKERDAIAPILMQKTAEAKHLAPTDRAEFEDRIERGVSDAEDPKFQKALLEAKAAGIKSQFGAGAGREGRMAQIAAAATGKTPQEAKQAVQLAKLEQSLQPDKNGQADVEAAAVSGKLDRIGMALLMTNPAARPTVINILRSDLEPDEKREKIQTLARQMAIEKSQRLNRGAVDINSVLRMARGSKP